MMEFYTSQASEIRYLLDENEEPKLNIEILTSMKSHTGNINIHPRENLCTAFNGSRKYIEIFIASFLQDKAIIK